MIRRGRRMASSCWATVSTLGHLRHSGQARVPLEDRGDLVAQVHPVEPGLGQHRRVDNALLIRVRVRVRVRG